MSDGNTPSSPKTTREFLIEGDLLKGSYSFLSPALAPNELGRLGDYRVLRLLGTGGMGIVFEAEELALARRVALKVLLPELTKDPENRERFLREARAAAAVASDHVVTIYNVASGDLPYLVMQFLEGETVQSRIDRRPALTLREALEITRQTALGLAAAHEKGLVHRDIKPANLWLEPVQNVERGTQSEASEETAKQDLPFRVKILDFGLARLVSGDNNLTSTGLVMGTPNYMSPEQASGLVVDGRSDLFSLGCVFYAMLTGNLPFPGHTAMGVMMALATKTPDRVDKSNPAIPKAVADLVAKLLRKKPDRRPASAREVAKNLQELLASLDENIPLRKCSPNETAGNYFVGETVVRENPNASLPTPVSSKVVLVDEPSTTTTRRKRQRLAGVVWALLGMVVLAVVGFGGRQLFWLPAPLPPEPILIGVLHSQTGTMAVSEGPLIDATVLAIEEINAAGGVLGRPLRAVIADGKSDPVEFQKAAERLIADDRVSVIFGCMTSPSRKAAKLVVERDNGLLFFPVSFEGLEQSPRIIYTGAPPNQKSLPSIEYVVKTLNRKRLFILGSNLVSPRSATEVIRDHMKLVTPECEIVATHFVPLGSTDMTEALDAIVAAKPDMILNILNGSSNFPFYRELRKRGIESSKVPTLSISLSEHDLVGLDPKLVAGDYLSANYFQSVDREENRLFLVKVKEKFGDQRVVTDNMVAAYSGVHLWAKAATKAGTPDPADVVKAIGGIEFEGPGGLIRIDPENHYAWRPWRVGQIQPDGTVKIVAAAPGNVRADPFPTTRTRRDWDRLLNELYVEWGGNWQAPGNP
ncbi:MAG: transporter substrate-binding protein [Planctomycetes bacterium]|nr:transporter substrate-binding protein [Planctomycetota bacterium]